MAGAMPLPISECRAYCELYKIHDVEIIDTLVSRIMFLDGVFLEHMAEKSKEKK